MAIITKDNNQTSGGESSSNHQIAVSAPPKTFMSVETEKFTPKPDTTSDYVELDPHSYPSTPIQFTKSHTVSQSASSSRQFDRSPPNPKQEKIERRHTVGIAGEIQELDLPEIVISKDSARLSITDGSDNVISPSSSSALPNGDRRPRRQKSDREVLVGTPVKEGHQNYTLMYDMLTGIRISVSRCNGKPMRDLTDADYEAAHKLAFDVAGNELTPSSKYDFKFKDYAPWVFRMIREAFKVDPADYLLSLTGKYVLSELGSPGKSGSFFYFSQDYRFIIKTIHHAEHRFMRKILKGYYEHCQTHPHTLLSRIFGLHRVKLPGNKKIHFVVMGNVFPSNKDIHEVYDLKGSTVGRSIPEEEARKNPRAVMKDLNWINRNKKLYLGEEKKSKLVEQMELDVAFLAKMQIMDYSLLVGCHDMQLGNKQNIRDQTLTVLEGSVLETISRNTSSSGGGGGKRRSRNMKKMMREIDSEALIAMGPSSARLPEISPAERRYCIFYQDQGGYQATDINNHPMNELYYIGIIDIFTKYDRNKKVETFFKGIVDDKKQISSVNPSYYGKRFLQFMKDSIVSVENKDSEVNLRGNSASIVAEEGKSNV
ncbi:Phosphatidylinositol-4-phosphate 5-kinase [Nowakowskiella sp. JEL0407]|nr:Phosphatidylinositol-4-phosphate 5-kinase [Nowakowskiella sp. JEL0407]